MEANLRAVKGRIHSTESFGAVDGPGVRFIVFTQGCPLRCLYCHNPDSWKFSEGQETTAGALIDEILSYKSFIAKGGVTLSGGDPLAQPEFTYALLSLCKENGLHTAIDTSGAIPLERCQKAVDAADMLLLDIKEIDSDDCEKLTGQGNENARRLLDYCENVGKPVWIRHVCLPGYTLKEEKLERLADYLKDYHCVEQVELIPFHQMGMYKWDYVDEPYLLKDAESPAKEEMAQARAIFEKRGLRVHG